METVFNPRRLEIEERVKQLSIERNYPLDITTAQRTLGPRHGALVPPDGCEIFISKVPREIFEDILFPLFETAGCIYKFRLLMSPSGISNRGTAFVTYHTSEMAGNAIEMFDQMEIAPGHTIHVRKSFDNRRLFIGGIPEDKTKDQVWHELIRMGMKGIMEVIMYRSYIDRNCNRGFVFVEFASHEEAGRVRAEFKNTFFFGNRVLVDWSAPLHSVDDGTMKQVTKLFLRNLNVLQEPEEFANVIINALGSEFSLEKIYKYRDYSFIHFISRRDAQRGLSLLREYFKNTNVEVCWAKPPPKKKNKENYSPTSSLPDSPCTSSQRPYSNNNIYYNNNPYKKFQQNAIQHAANCSTSRSTNCVRGDEGQSSFCRNCLNYMTGDELTDRTAGVVQALNL